MGWLSEPEDPRWKGLVETLGAEHVPVRLFRGNEKLLFTLGGWRVTLDRPVNITRAYTLTWSRLRSEALADESFWLKAKFRFPIDRLRARLSRYTVATGHPDFDDVFFVRSNDPERARRVFDDGELRRRLLERTFALYVRVTAPRRSGKPARVELKVAAPHDHLETMVGQFARLTCVLRSAGLAPLPVETGRA